ncbi:hypothetical protein DRQ09_09100 [candidate division KSB1 bacterium]|nr:MAG: hypothetical protein DRQ09_09100 [candidate division KSB1 bacterium]
MNFLIKKLIKNQEGFTLLHLIMIIVSFGILAAVSVRFMVYATSEGKKTSAIKEMKEILRGIYGEPELTNQTNFGYIGDMGQFPPSLDKLYDGRGEGANWDGPYVSIEFVESESELLNDPWNQPYVIDYNDGLIKSVGSGDDIVVNFHVSSSKLLNNRLKITVKDWNDKEPKWFSYFNFRCRLYRIGNKGTKNILVGTLNSYNASSKFTFTNIPVGNYRVEVRYSTENITQKRYVTIYPTGITTNLTIKFSTSFPQSLF